MPYPSVQYIHGSKAVPTIIYISKARQICLCAAAVLSRFAFNLFNRNINWMINYLTTSYLHGISVIPNITGVHSTIVQLSEIMTRSNLNIQLHQPGRNQVVSLKFIHETGKNMINQIHYFFMLLIFCLYYRKKL